MEKGILYWITGLSGAGKTTIGSGLYYELKKKWSNLVILDGDILKGLVDNSLGYSREERLKRAYYYSNICKLLTDQGINVIICTIAMYDAVREWNRENIERYVEVYLKVDKEVLIERDRKGLYSGQKDGKVFNVAGIDSVVEFPKTPDIVIENNGERSVSECISEILQYQVKEKDSFNRDVIYWNNYYKTELKELKEPSDFAKEVSCYLKKGKSLIDLGCGNGRDSLFFAKQGIKVTGIDASEVAISNLNKLNISEADFVCDDFVTSRTLYQIQWDYFYSRWTMHAISEQQEDVLLKNISEGLREKGLLFIEARSINDGLYGKGKKVSENAFIYNGHYRRFMDKTKFLNKLSKNGFDIVEVAEGNDFSKTETSNPVLVRVIARKRFL